MSCLTGYRTNMSMEVWRPIPGFPGYDVSNMGRVRSYMKCIGLSKWHIADTPVRVLSPGGRCRKMVQLRRDNEAHAKRIAPLVLLAFVGPRPEGLHVCHNNGDSSDDRLPNLRYDTPQENMRDTMRNGKRKLTEDAVIEIRQRRASGESTVSIARDYDGVSAQNVSSVSRGASYAYVGGPITSVGMVQHANTKLSDEDVAAIHQKRSGGRTLLSLAEEYGVTEAHMSRVCRRERRGRVTQGVQQTDT